MTLFRHAFTGATLDYPPGHALHADLVDSPLWDEQGPDPDGAGADPEGDPSDPEEEADDERPPARCRRRRTAPGSD